MPTILQVAILILGVLTQVQSQSYIVEHRLESDPNGFAARATIEFLPEGVVEIEMDTFYDFENQITSDIRLVNLTNLPDGSNGTFLYPDTIAPGYRYISLSVPGYYAEVISGTNIGLECGCGAAMNPPKGCAPVRTENETRCQNNGTECTEVCVGWISSAIPGPGPATLTASSGESTVVLFLAKKVNYTHK